MQAAIAGNAQAAADITCLNHGNAAVREALDDLYATLATVTGYRARPVVHRVGLDVGAVTRSAAVQPVPDSAMSSRNTPRAELTLK